MGLVFLMNTFLRKVALSFVLIILCWPSGLFASTDKDERIGSLGVSTFYKSASSFLLSEKYDSAFHYLSLAETTYKQNQDWEHLVRTYLCFSDYYYKYNNQDKARDYVNKAEGIIPIYSFNDKSISDEVELYKLQMLAYERSYNTSVEPFEKFIVSQEGDSKSRLTSKAYFHISNIYANRQERKMATSYLQKAIKTLPPCKESDLTLINYYACIAFSYMYSNKIDSALMYCNMGAEIRDQYNASSAILLRMTGMVYSKMLDYKKGIKLLKESEVQYIKNFGRHCNSLSYVYTSLAEINWLLGDYSKSKKYYEYILNVYENQAVLNYGDIGKAHQSIGYACSALGNHEEAISSLNKSIFFTKKGNKSSFLGTNYQALANCYSQSQNKAKAQEFFQQALKDYSLHYGNDHVVLGSQYMEYGKFCRDYEQYDEANSYFHEALSIYKRNYGEQSYYNAMCYKFLGGISKKQGNAQLAIKYYQKALVSLSNNCDEEDYFSAPSIKQVNNPYLLWTILQSKANTFVKIAESSLDEKDLQIALTTYEQTICVLEELRAGYQSDNSKLSITKEGKSALNAALKTAMKLYSCTGDEQYCEKAFQFSEKAKAANLLASLQEMKARNTLRVSEELLNKEEKLNKEIASLEKSIYEEEHKEDGNKKQIKKWEIELFELQREQEELIAQLEEESPEYHQLKYQNETVSVKKVQQQLGNNNVLVEYALTNKALYSFVISNSDFRVNSIAVGDDFREDVMSFVKMISEERYDAYTLDDYKSYTQTAYALYEKLLLPHEDMLGANKDLIIIPDEILGYVSFEALLSKKVNDEANDYSVLPYLVTNHSLNYLYSSSLLEKAKKKTEPAGDLLAFAPVYRDMETDGTKDLIALRSVRDHLVPLYATVDEVSGIGKILSGQVFLEEEATESAFKSLSKKGGILHMAMHAFVDHENPLYSKLIFSKEEGEEDGLLNAYEIYNMNIQSDLVVLSACNTGIGQLNKGEGVMSLARAFINSGCPSVVMTLWTVRDKAGAMLMNDFYEFLSEGSSKSKALQAAKNNYLTNSDPVKSHPYYWAGYVNIGDASPINTTKAYTTPLASSLVAAFGLFVFFFIRRRRG